MVEERNLREENDEMEMVAVVGERNLREENDEMEVVAVVNCGGKPQTRKFRGDNVRDQLFDIF